MEKKRSLSEEVALRQAKANELRRLELLMKIKENNNRQDWYDKKNGKK